MYYFGILYPDSLTDEEWCMRWRELEFVRKKEADSISRYPQVKDEYHQGDADKN